MRKRLVHEKVDTAQDLLAEALATRRKLRPGILIRYCFNAFTGQPPEAELHQGVDRIELLRTKEPRVFLERLKQWVYSKECLLLPRDSRYKELEARHESKLKN